MLLDPKVAVAGTQILLGGGLLLQSIELFCARKIYAPAGALPGVLDVKWLLAGRTVLAVWLLFISFQPKPAGTVAGMALLLISSFWLTLRSRGPVGGGSDSMWFQVQLGLLVVSLGAGNLPGLQLGLGWIAAQSVLSYFLAGLGKLRHAGWRDGTALRRLFISTGPYVLWPGVRRWAEVSGLCRGLSWAVVGFELAFPVVLLLPFPARLVFLGAALGFHLANALVLGLNRFVWAWAATYPALLSVGAQGNCFFP